MFSNYKNIIIFYYIKMLYIFIFLFFFLQKTDSFFRNTRIIKNKSLFMLNNDKQYTYAKEYYDFYKKYKIKSNALQSSFLVNYEEFAEKHKNNYIIFENNYELIKNTNNDLTGGNSSFTIELNKYADIINFNDNDSQDLNYKLSSTDNIVKTFDFHLLFKNLLRPLNILKKKNENIRVNWNNTEYLSEVKDQGQCGSCYAFSTINVLETFMRINNYTVDRLSEQQIVDCSPNDYGCEGGFMHNSLDFIIDNKGLLSNDDYKYMGITQNCTTTKTEQNVVGSNITEYQFVTPSSVQDLKDCVMKTPIAIAVDANNVYFRFYKKGVIDVPLQMTNVLNHAVVLVGFDYDEDGMYWIIQNSWGKDWGDNGFCKIRVKEGNGVLLCQKYGVYPIK